MNNTLSYILLCLGFVLVCGLGFLIKERTHKYADGGVSGKASKLFAGNGKWAYRLLILLPILFFVAWYMGGHLFVTDTSGFVYATRVRDITGLVSLWLAGFGVITLGLLAAYDFGLLRLVNQYVVLPACIVMIVFFQNGIFAITGGSSGLWRAYPYALFVGAMLGLSLVCIWRRSDFVFLGAQKPKVPDTQDGEDKKKDGLFGRLGLASFEKEHLPFVWLPLAMLLATMPIMLPQNLLLPKGYLSIYEIAKFDKIHRALLYGLVIVPLVIFLAARKQSRTAQKAICMFVAFSALIAFSTRINLDMSITGLPLQLCNTAVYIIPLCLVFRMKRLFYFTYFINVIGAVLAIIFTPTFNTHYGLYGQDVLHYMWSHYVVFFVPILMLSFGIYERPTLKRWGYAIAVFSIYFVGIIFVNYWYFSKGYETNFFFIISDFLPNKLGGFGSAVYKNLVRLTIKGKVYLVHPTYLVSFFVAFLALSLVMWFVMNTLSKYTVQIVQSLDEYKQHRTEHREFLQKIANQKTYGEIQTTRGRELMTMIQDMNPKSIKLEITNFSKKYSGGKVYSAKNVNLTVQAGQIFGFLGPNGAGKS
ncbi:MAG: YwaF family protein, partial [Firmicutes bacterium]|nr:YwaF family protein [Bacillota bacterium]